MINSIANKIDLDELVKDQKAFSQFVYTPQAHVKREYLRRWNDAALNNMVQEFLHGDIPQVLEDGHHAVIFRHICTSSNELHNFIDAAAELGWDPVFGEYHQDKFTANNSLKYHLGRIPFHSGYGKKGGAIINYESVIDFNLSDGKRLSAIETEWGQPLIEFHHELFKGKYPQINNHMFYESSDWFKRNGGSAKKYYEKFLSLFLRNGVLFENFCLGQKEERFFAKEYFLPAFIRITEEFSYKPMIVDLTPTDLTGDIYWLAHGPEDAEIIERKRKMGYNVLYGSEHMS